MPPQISLCVDDFESLVVLVSSMIEGQDPSSSMLLGVKTGPSLEPGLGELDGSSSVHKQLELMDKLKTDIERLRTVVTERYADHIANDCSVQ